MTAPPSWRVEIAFETGANPSAWFLGVSRFPLALGDAAATTWTDVTSDCKAISVQRGKSRELEQYQAGRCVVELDNLGRDYDPLNLSGPHVADGVTLVKPGRRIRVFATHPVTEVEYPVFYGVVRDWDVDLSGAPDPIARCLATDAMFELANTKVGVTTSAALSGVVVGEILADAGIVNYDVDEGNSTLQATTFEGTAQAALRVVEQSEQGHLFVERDGSVVFLERHALLEQTRHNTSQATFGAGTLELGAPPDVRYESDLVKNHVLVTRAGGSEQEAIDSASVNEYGERLLSLSGLASEDDSAALALAQYLIGDRAQPAVRVRSITIAPQAHDDLMTQALARLLLDRVTVSWTPLGGSVVTQNVHLIGIQHDFRPPAPMVTTFTCAPVSPMGAWRLGVGELGDASGPTATVLTY